MTLSYTALAVIGLVITGLVIALVVAIKHSINSGIAAGRAELINRQHDDANAIRKKADEIDRETNSAYAHGERPNGVSKFDL